MSKYCYFGCFAQHLNFETEPHGFAERSREKHFHENMCV